jgi:hypothetical protein
MKILATLFILSLALWASMPRSEAEPPAIVNETLSGWSFRAIEAATAELKRRGLYIDDYQIFVRRRGRLLVVLFGNPGDADLFKVGCAGPRPCLTVELTVEEFVIISSQYGAQR